MSVIRYVLPEPPQGRYWCVVCAGIYLYVVSTSQKDLAKEITDDPGSGYREIKGAALGTNLPMLNIAVTKSVYMPFLSPGNPFQNQVVDVCWSHVLALEIKLDAGVIPARAGSEEMVAQQLQQMGAKVLGAPKPARQRESQFGG